MSDGKNATQSKRPWALLVVVAWLVPGLGHFLLGRKLRALVFAGLIAVSFILGIVLNGELVLPKHGDPISYLAAVASLGSGALFLVAKFMGLGLGDITSAGFDFGKTFFYTAGLMNLLLLLDVHDIAVGKKEW